MSSSGSVYAWCGCRERVTGGGWEPGARSAAARGTAAGTCRWSCPPARTRGGAGSAAAGSRPVPMPSGRWRGCRCPLPVITARR
jgi:hypothetical protein